MPRTVRGHPFPRETGPILASHASRRQEQACDHSGSLTGRRSRPQRAGNNPDSCNGKVQFTQARLRIGLLSGRRRFLRTSVRTPRSGWVSMKSSAPLPSMSDTIDWPTSSFAIDALSICRESPKYALSVIPETTTSPCARTSQPCGVSSTRVSCMRGNPVPSLPAGEMGHPQSADSTSRGLWVSPFDARSSAASNAAGRAARWSAACAGATTDRARTPGRRGRLGAPPKTAPPQEESARLEPVGEEAIVAVSAPVATAEFVVAARRRPGRVCIGLAYGAADREPAAARAAATAVDGVGAEAIACGDGIGKRSVFGAECGQWKH